MSERIPGRITTVSPSSPQGYLNLGSGDVTQGGYPSLNSPLTTGDARLRAGQLGFELEVQPNAVADEFLSNPLGTQLYQGWYQYVQLDPTSPIPALGGLLFAPAASFLNGSYIVSATPTVLSFVVGVNILPVAPGWTPGNYWWMQTQGIASVLSIAAAFGGIAAAIGGLMTAISVGGTSGRMDTMNETSVATFDTSMRSLIGRAIDLPVVNTVTRVNLSRMMARLV